MKKLLLLSLIFSCSTYGALSWVWKSKAPVQPFVYRIGIVDPVNVDKVMDQLVYAYKSPNVAGVIISIDCNGGAASRFSMLHDIIKQLKVKKPVVVLVVGDAYSAGYLVASAADYIFAHSQSGVGSIGVYKTLESYQNTKIKKNYLEADLTVDFLSAGEHKLLANPLAGPATERQRERAQEQLNKSYQLFINQVSYNRGIAVEDYIVWAEGCTFFSPEALELGLIDEIGTIFDAEQKIKDLIVARDESYRSHINDIRFRCA